VCETVSIHFLPLTPMNAHFSAPLSRIVKKVILTPAIAHADNIQNNETAGQYVVPPLVPRECCNITAVFRRLDILLDFLAPSVGFELFSVFKHITVVHASYPQPNRPKGMRAYLNLNSPTNRCPSGCRNEESAL
jgi:hypothetical protein